MSDLREIAESANSTTNLVESKTPKQPEQEPVVWLYTDAKGREVLVGTNTKPYENAQPLYTAKQVAEAVEAAIKSRQWVGLTDEELEECFVFDWSGEFYKKWRKETYEAIEAKLKEKNTWQK